MIIDQDEFYRQILKLQSKSFLEFDKYQYEVSSNRKTFELIWATEDVLAECFEVIIVKLKHSK